MIIKALTLWQPWASFMALGLKKNETRSWDTKYRGPLAIHAATRRERVFPEGVVSLAVRIRLNKHLRYPWPFGKILCIVELFDTKIIVRPPADPIEAELGYYAPGRFVWKTKLIKVFDPPIPARGYQGLWDWEWNKGDTK